MESRNVFLYWVGKKYKLISILKSLIYLHSTTGKGYKVNLITDENINKYVKNIPSCFNQLCAAHQADFVRVNVICDYGGLWLDSDTIILNSLDDLFNFIENKNGFFIKENNKTLSNGIFGSKPNTELMIRWKNELINILNNKSIKINWTELGNCLLQNMYNSNSNLYNDYHIFNGLDNLYPVSWQYCISEFIDKPYDNYKTIIREYQPLIVLVNSVYKKLETMTEKEILEGNMPLNYFINKSLENKSISKNELYTIQYIYNYIKTDNILKSIFQDIYKTQLWNNADPNIPLSGPGSSLENAKNCSDMINEFIYNNDCKSVIDLGCGDLTWMSKTNFFNDNNIKYTGIDVVDNLIISHSKIYPKKKFINEDIITYKDFENVDIMIIRDVIFHLKNSEILSIFDNIKNKFKFLLITSCLNENNTDNFDKWYFSKKNIHKEPFNKSHNFLNKVFEKSFNRNVYIYAHDYFYN
jgi:hypothetical protein